MKTMSIQVLAQYWKKKDDFRHLLMHFARKPKKQCQQYYT